MKPIPSGVKVLAWLVLLGSLVCVPIVAVGLSVLVVKVPGFPFGLIEATIVFVSVFLACIITLALWVLGQRPPTAH